MVNVYFSLTFRFLLALSCSLPRSCYRRHQCLLPLVGSECVATRVNIELTFINSVRIIMADRWKCIICSFVCLFLSQLLSHLKNIHRDDLDFCQKCRLPGCLSKTDYTSTNSLIKHVRTSHHAPLNCKYETVRKGVDETGT